MSQPALFFVLIILLEPESREAAKQLWMVFKTFLFCFVMISQATLSNVRFLPPSPNSSVQPSAMALSKGVLDNLYEMAFLISKFGGLTTNTENSGFRELRKVFYEALDVLSSDSRQSEEFVLGLVKDEGRSSRGMCL